MNIFEVLINRECIFSNNIIYCSEHEERHIIDFSPEDILKGRWCNSKQHEDYFYDVFDDERKFIIYMDISSSIEHEDEEDYKIFKYKNNKKKKEYMEIYNSILREEKETFDIDRLESHDKEFRIINYEGARRDCQSFKKENKEQNIFNKPAMIGYVRVSTHHQVKNGFSIEAQQKLIRDEAEKKEAYLRAIYIDAGISGKYMERRTALNKMFEEVRHGDYVVFSDISRLARNSREHGNITQILLDKKCKIKALDMNMEYGVDPMSDLIIQMTASISEVESKRITAKVKTGMRIKNESGTLPKKPKYGFKRGDDHKNIVDEEEMKIIDKIIKIRKNYPQLSRNQYYAFLDNLKIPHLRKSNQWTHRNAGKILDSRGIP